MRPGQRPRRLLRRPARDRPRPLLLPPRPRRAPAPWPAARRRSVRSRRPGISAPVYPVLGDHDILVAGELVPTPQTRALALGDQALWELPPGLTVPPGTQLTGGGSPDGPPLPGLVNQFLAQALAGPKVRVPADPRRREMSRRRGHLRRSAAPAPERSLDYAVDVGHEVRLIVLDLARRGGGSGGLVRPDQPGWLASQLEKAGGARSTRDRRLAPAAAELGRRGVDPVAARCPPSRDRRAVRPHPPQLDRAARAATG